MLPATSSTHLLNAGVLIYMISYELAICQALVGGEARARRPRVRRAP